MIKALQQRLIKPVALLAEGVDRNIEEYASMQSDEVALLAEGVDRNRMEVSRQTYTNKGRPPRGGRG